MINDDHKDYDNNSVQWKTKVKWLKWWWNASCHIKCWSCSDQTSKNDLVMSLMLLVASNTHRWLTVVIKSVESTLDCPRNDLRHCACTGSKCNVTNSSPRTFKSNSFSLWLIRMIKALAIVRLRVKKSQE